MANWLNINSAPRDGTIVDLWAVNGGRRVDCRWQVPDSQRARDWPKDKADWCYYHGEWGEWVELGEDVSHWMPLPPAPEHNPYAGPSVTYSEWRALNTMMPLYANWRGLFTVIDAGPTHTIDDPGHRHELDYIQQSNIR